VEGLARHHLTRRARGHGTYLFSGQQLGAIFVIEAIVVFIGVATVVVVCVILRAWLFKAARW
jgi:hypothetical protein